MFNTEEEILTYAPYFDISMLAITPTTAYEICAIKKDGVCIDSFSFTETNYNYFEELERNKYAISWDDGKVLLIRENMCNDTCDESIYVLKDFQFGLCKQLFPDTPYKLINTPNCLSSIPEGADIYDSKLYLLKCKNWYKLESDTCILKFYLLYFFRRWI